jgi:hypothetical protein
MPAWLFSVGIFLFITIILGLLISGALLENKFISPYTLLNATHRERAKQAIILALLQTSIIPLIGIALIIQQANAAKWLAMFFALAQFWMIVLLIVIIYKLWNFEWHIRNYKKIDKLVKNGTYERFFHSPFAGWTRIFMNKEHKRFFTEGFQEKNSDDLQNTQQ